LWFLSTTWKNLGKMCFIPRKNKIQQKFSTFPKSKLKKKKKKKQHWVEAPNDKEFLKRSH
jgi:hypothetical protein